MPPVTRRALRSKTSLVDNNDTPTTKAESLISETHPTTTNARPVLGEVAGNNSEAATAASGQTAQKRATKKPTVKGKGKGSSVPRKGNSKLETTQRRTGSTRVKTPKVENKPLGKKEPRKKEPQKNKPVESEATLSEELQKGIGVLSKPEAGGAVDVQSPVGQPTEVRLSPSQHKTPKFDPKVHVSPVTDDLAEEAEDSFLESIVKRSPRRLADGLKDAHEYSITPNRQPSRIEDSMEAIDAFEDALEQIGQALPDVDNGFDSPEPVDSVEVGKRTNQASGTKGRATEPEPPTNRSPCCCMNGSEITGSQSRSVSPKKPENTPATASNDGDDPASTATAKESTTPTAQTQRGPFIGPCNLSTSKPGFVPAKSTKPPTRPDFELPGEVISRLQKERREEKARKEEEERQRKREFKAKPVRINSTPTYPVKENAASRGRLRASLARDDPEAQEAPSPSTPSKTPTSPASKLTSWGSKRASLATLATRTPPVSQDQEAAAAAAAAAAAGVGSPTASVSDVDLDAGQVMSPRGRGCSVVTPADTAHQRARGKEIFQRDKLEWEERARERREREEAAKKARDDASQRGRLIGRAWAERKRLAKESGK